MWGDQDHVYTLGEALRYFSVESLSIRFPFYNGRPTNGRPTKEYLLLWFPVPMSNPLETSFPQSSPEARDSGLER